MGLTKDCQRFELNFHVCRYSKENANRTRLKRSFDKSEGWAQYNLSKVLSASHLPQPSIVTIRDKTMHKKFNIHRLSSLLLVHDAGTCTQTWYQIRCLLHPQLPSSISHSILRLVVVICDRLELRSVCGSSFIRLDLRVLVFRHHLNEDSMEFTYRKATEIVPVLKKKTFSQCHDGIAIIKYMMKGRSLRMASSSRE